MLLIYFYAKTGYCFKRRRQIPQILTPICNFKRIDRSLVLLYIAVYKKEFPLKMTINFSSKMDAEVHKDLRNLSSDSDNRSWPSEIYMLIGCTIPLGLKRADILKFNTCTWTPQNKNKVEGV